MSFDINRLKGGAGSFMGSYAPQGQVMVAQPAPAPIVSAPRSTAYKPNPFTMQQLAQFQPQQGLLSAQNPIYQQYLAKMAGYGAGAGKTAPSQSQGANNG